MSNFIPQRPTGSTGLSPKAQKLQALREKAAAAAAATSGVKPVAAGSPNFKAKSDATRKTAFQRKAT
jgi:hypothetical protein